MPVKKDYPHLRQQGARYYYDHGGKPRHWEPLGKDWTKALARYQEIVSGHKASGDTVSALIDKYMAALSGLKPTTLTNYRKSAKIIHTHFGDAPPHQVEQKHVHRFIDKQPAKMMARNAVLFLKTVLTWGYSRGHVKENKLVGLRLKGQNRRERYLTDGEFMAIREHLKEPFQIAADLAYVLGLRVSGAVRLKFSHAKDGEINFHPPKSKKPLKVRITPDVQDILDRAMRQTGACGLYVVHSRTGQPYGEATVSKAIRLAAAKAGIEDVRFHDIRRKSANDEPETARGRLGHTDQRTTNGYLVKPVTVTPIGRIVERK
jgi:integrase